jgi:aminoglycoside phosphotransferase (APT) family kinase protein
MMGERMHLHELEIGEELVRGLLDDQFPQFADMALRRIEPSGTVNAIFRLGTDLSVRLARVDGPTEPGGKEFDWLGTLAPELPLSIPVVVAQGRPTQVYPWFWDIHTWVEGETVAVAEIDEVSAARDLARFIAALWRVDAAGAPPGRGVGLAERDAELCGWLEHFDGDPSVRDEWDRALPLVAAEWERALAVPAWEGPPVWCHGDLDTRNWLVRNGRITGIVDWGEMGVGDPACDVMVAWKLGSRRGRDAFRDALDVDDAMWARARGWVISQAAMALAYYTSQNNRVLFEEARRWLGAALDPA